MIIYIYIYYYNIDTANTYTTNRSIYRYFGSLVAATCANYTSGLARNGGGAHVIATHVDSVITAAACRSQKWACVYMLYIYIYIYIHIHTHTYICICVYIYI